MMRKNNGITMLSLITTIVVLLILSSITINVGVGSYNIVKVQNFIAKLKVIQGKVDTIAEKTNEDTDFQIEYGFTPLSSVSRRR